MTTSEYPSSMQWMQEAACAREPARRLPWMSDADDVPWVIVDLIRQVCTACPVHGDCAAYAVDQEVTGGWWAGVNRARESRLVTLAESVQLLLCDLHPELWEHTLNQSRPGPRDGCGKAVA